MNHECTVYKTMDYLAKRWTFLILLELYKGQDRMRRFSELKNTLMDVTPKILSQRLKELEAEGLIERIIDASTIPLKSEYRLTDSGVELIIAIKTVKTWALKWQIENSDCGSRDCSACLN
ncbi:MAG: helix-turn-helix transcriptional regulator [Methanomassiliicoccaceae archaeon]|nr:helix-turn-helix transcriptional regulator [Methanomassiliicoccaceae archaeon]